MNYDQERIDKWNNDFFEYLKKDNVDLILLFDKLIFLPNYDSENSYKVAYYELDERYASKEQIRRMAIVFEKYCSTNKV